MIYEALVGDPDVDQHFADTALVEAMLFVEASLARAQAALGIIPESAADAISKSTTEDEYDLEALVLGVHLPGVRRILVVPHTRCAMSTSTLAERRARVAESAGVCDTWQPFGVVQAREARPPGDGTQTRARPPAHDRPPRGAAPGAQAFTRGPYRAW